MGGTRIVAVVHVRLCVLLERLAVHVARPMYVLVLTEQQPQEQDAVSTMAPFVQVVAKVGL
jgi:hypothetical protein